MVKGNEYTHVFQVDEPTSLRKNEDDGLWEIETDTVYFAFPIENLIYFQEVENLDGE